MKELKQLYISEKLNSSVLISPFKNTYYNFEIYNYFISRDLKKEYEGAFLSGCFLNLYHILDLKEFKIEISEIR